MEFLWTNRCQVLTTAREKAHSRLKRNSCYFTRVNWECPSSTVTFTQRFKGTHGRKRYKEGVLVTKHHKLGDLKNRHWFLIAPEAGSLRSRKRAGLLVSSEGSGGRIHSRLLSLAWRRKWPSSPSRRWKWTPSLISSRLHPSASVSQNFPSCRTLVNIKIGL